MKRPVRISILQVSSSSSKEEAAKKIMKLASVATGDILVLPEYAMIDLTDIPAEELYGYSETLEGSWVRMLSTIAREKNACIVGTMFERSEEPPRVYNTAVFIDQSGEVKAVYRKTHLFDILGFRESEKIKPGDKLFTPIDLCGVRVGAAICFEIRYPEIFRLQALEGVDVFVIPSGWYLGHGKEEAYRVLAQARAHENVAYVAGAVLAGARFTGRSVIVDPYGIVRAEGGFGEAVVEHTLDPELLEEARRRMPLLDLRRNDLYSLKWV